MSDAGGSAPAGCGPPTSGSGGPGCCTFQETTIQREMPPAMLSQVSAYDWFVMLPRADRVCRRGRARQGAKRGGGNMAGGGVLLVFTAACLAAPAVSGLLAPP